MADAGQHLAAQQDDDESPHSFCSHHDSRKPGCEKESHHLLCHRNPMKSLPYFLPEAS
jgi:hypothetical protein